MSPGTVLIHLGSWRHETCLIQGVDAGAQAAMDTKDLLINYGGQTQVVEHVRAIPPHVHRTVLRTTNRIILRRRNSHY